MEVKIMRKKKLNQNVISNDDDDGNCERNEVGKKLKRNP